MSEKISVIIPLYNKEKEIKRCIDSVLCQTFQDFEIIVVDDHSSDNGPAIVKSISDPRIHLIEQDQNHGVSYTRNHGVHRSRFEYISFIDADDEWMPNHLDTIIRLIKKFPDAGIFTTAYNIHTATGETRWPDYKCIPPHPWEGLIPDYFRSVALGSVAIGDWPTNSSVVAMPKSIFYERGEYPVGYWMSEDSALYINIALKYPVAFSWELGATIHWDASNRAGQKNMDIDYEDPSVKIAKIALQKGEVPAKFIESLNEYIYKMEITRAIHYVRTGRSDTAHKILKKCNTKWQYNDKIKWLLLSKIPYPLFRSIQYIRQKIMKLVQKFF